MGRGKGGPAVCTFENIHKWLRELIKYLTKTIFHNVDVIWRKKTKQLYIFHSTVEWLKDSSSCYKTWTGQLFYSQNCFEELEKGQQYLTMKIWILLKLKDHTDDGFK